MQRHGWTSRQDREDGFDVRHVAHDGEEIIARMFFAVRDPLWRTVALREVERVDLTQGDQVIRRIVARTDDERFPVDVDLDWTFGGRTFHARARARARGDFEYARIGLCVLLSTTVYAAKPARMTRHGQSWAVVLPQHIATRSEYEDEESSAFHEPFEELRVQLDSGTEVAMRFEGELFEFEDQRNWTDRSFKAYSVSDGWPFTASEGQIVEQAVSIEVLRSAQTTRSSRRAGISIGAGVGTLCDVGVSAAEPIAGGLRPAGGLAELLASPRRGASPGVVQLAVNGTVHAADDESVAESALVHGDVVLAASSHTDGAAIVLDPIAFLDEAGDWRDDDGLFDPAVPPTSHRDRWSSEMAAAWVVASVATAAPAGAARLGYFGPGLPADSPATEVLRRFEKLVGWTMLRTEAPDPLAAIALAPPDGEGPIVLAVANLDPDPVTVAVDGGGELRLDGYSTVWLELPARAGTRDPVPAEAGDR